MPAQDAAVAALEKAGKPVVTIRVATKYDLGEEFVRWEIATAIAGALMGINPFNQPDVEASKLATKALTSEYEKTGNLPSETPFYEGEGVRLFADAKNVAALQRVSGSGPVARRLSEGASRSPDRRRLFRAAGLHRDERRQRSGAPAFPASRARPEARGHLPRLRAAVPPFDRPGLQGRPQQRRVPPDHVRRRARICRCLARSTPSASSRPPRRAATFRCWPSAIVARSGSISVRMWPRASELSSQRWTRRWRDHGERADTCNSEWSDSAGWAPTWCAA